MDVFNTTAYSYLIGMQDIYAFLLPLLPDPATSVVTPDTMGPLMALGVVVIIAALFAVYKCCQRLGMKPTIESRVKAVKEFVAPSKGPRFRKRDRMAFLGTKAMRNAKAVGTYITGRQGRKRRDMARLVKRVFLKGSPSASLAGELRPDLPSEYLEEEGSRGDYGDGTEGVPESLVLVLKNLRVFGHFENTILLELMKNIEYVTLRANDYLFRVGDPDSGMFIVESGALSVCYESSEGGAADKSDKNDGGSTHGVELKQVTPGEPIVSLLSFLDYLAGKRKVFKTVSARALQDTKLIKFSFESFKDCFDKHPENMAQVVQVVMVRLQRVTLLALHQYLGLGAELLSAQPRGNLHGPRRVHHSSGAGGGAAASSNSGGTPGEGSAASADPSPNSPEKALMGSLKPIDPDQPRPKELSPQSSTTTEEPIFVQVLCPVLQFITQAVINGSFIIITLIFFISLQTAFARTKKKLSQMGEEQLRNLCTDGFKLFLGLSEEDLIEDARSMEMLKDFEVASYNEGDVICEEDTSVDGPLYLIISGCVSVSQRDGDNVPREMHRAYQGGLLGQLQVLK